MRTTPEQRLGEEGPDINATLLALLVEITSVSAAGAQLKKPITGLLKAIQPRKSVPAQRRSDAFDRGFALLASTSNPRGGDRR